MTERTIGYILLVTGIIVMIYSTFQIIAVFTGKTKPVQIVKYDKPTKSSLSEELLGDLQKNSPSMPELFDAESLNEIINLSVYYLIMQLLLGLGFKFSTLGVSMLRPIVVQVKNTKLESVIETESQTK